ncbi:hypothetical protein RSAG8_07376, partial [Rhizoctonia solani AG-8 WAC10335]
MEVRARLRCSTSEGGLVWSMLSRPMTTQRKAGDTYPDSCRWMDPLCTDSVVVFIQPTWLLRWKTGVGRERDVLRLPSAGVSVGRLAILIVEYFDIKERPSTPPYRHPSFFYLTNSSTHHHIFDRRLKTIMAFVAGLDDAKSLKETLLKLVGRDTALDDRTGILNKIFAVVPKLPPDSEASKTMNDYLVKLLYETLPHPPSSYVGEDRFRRADGGRNNVNMPDLGRAGTTYARNVQGRQLQSPTCLPPTSMVVDELLMASSAPRGSPEVLRIIEIMGMEQARKWGVCTMNEFRKYLGLKTFGTFEEWNSNPVIATAAKKLYRHIDNLELYPGLHAEECMRLGPGSGLCAGYTITRAILADAIALVRGDRFFTTDFTPERLTSWGFQDVKRDPNNGALGAYLPKLLMRTFPRHYTYNSAYSLFPFFTPETTKQNLTKLKLADQYDFARPRETPIPKPLNNFTAIKYVSNEITKYKVPYGPDMRYITFGRAMFLAYDEEPVHNNDRIMGMHALYPSNEVVKGHADYYDKKIRELIGCKSYKFDNIPGTFVDILEVINCTCIHWAADNLCGITMKYEKNPYGEMGDVDLYWKSTVLFEFVLRNSDPHLGWKLRKDAKTIADEINSKIKANFERLQTPPIAGPIFLGLKAAVESATGQKRPSDTFHKALLASKKPINDLVAMICGMLVGSTVNFAQATSHMVDFYMDDARKKEPAVESATGQKRPSDTFHKALLASKKPINDLVAMICGMLVGSTVNFAQATSHMVDFYMDDARKKEREHLIQLATKNDPESIQLLIGYYREAARLNPQFPALPRVAAVQDEIPQGAGKPSISVKPGDRLFLSYRNAHLDPELFPNPETVDPRRPKDNYGIQAIGAHGCPGLDATEQCMAMILREIFKLKNIRRAPGVLGQLDGFDNNVLGTKIRSYIDDKGGITSWPTSLVVVYDA